jgi:putative DNA primase/helicase
MKISPDRSSDDFNIADTNDRGSSVAPAQRPPRPPEPQWDSIPSELKARAQWMLWTYEFRNGRWTKVPHQPDGTLASSTNPATWAPFDFVATAYLTSGVYDGVGFVLTADDPYVGWDFDHCFDPAACEITDPRVRKHVARLDSYVEVTPSGSGLRGFARGKLPPGGRKRGDIECYEDKRYLTVTGCHLDSTPTEIQDRQAEIAAIHAEVFKREGSQGDAAARPATPSLSLDDAALLDKARKAKDGPRFIALYDRGDWRAGGFPSQSEADLWLAGKLAFWTGRETARIDALFRRSALMRDKWLRKDYRERTLAAATAGCAQAYAPRTAQREGHADCHQGQRENASGVGGKHTAGNGGPSQGDSGKLLGGGSAGKGRGKPPIGKQLAHNEHAPRYSDIYLSDDRFVAEYGKNLRHVSELDEWRIYDEKESRWIKDETMRPFTWVRQTLVRAARQWRDEILANDGNKKTAEGAARSLTTAPKVANVVSLARSHKNIAMRMAQFDRDSWLLNTPSGVVNLRNGTIRQGRREDYMTKVTPVAPKRMATPNFDKFIREIMGDLVPLDKCACAACVESRLNGRRTEADAKTAHAAEVTALVDYVLRIYSYTLTGDVRDHILVMS